MALDPPLPPITIDQIQHGQLSALLEEDDYNLASMVNIKLYILIISIITSLLNHLYPLSSNLATTKLVFPMKSIPLVIAGLPESLLPFSGPETLSC